MLGGVAGGECWEGWLGVSVGRGGWGECWEGWLGVSVGRGGWG